MDAELMKRLLVWVELKDLAARQRSHDHAQRVAGTRDVVPGLTPTTKAQLVSAEAALYDYARMTY